MWLFHFIMTVQYVQQAAVAWSALTVIIIMIIILSTSIQSTIIAHVVVTTAYCTTSLVQNADSTSTEGPSRCGTGGNTHAATEMRGRPKHKAHTESAEVADCNDALYSVLNQVSTGC